MVLHCLPHGRRDGLQPWAWTDRRAVSPLAGLRRSAEPTGRLLTRTLDKRGGDVACKPLV